jgi:hypothetical protein
LVMLLGLVFNTSEQIIDKTRSQNGIDAAVMTQATWTARSLNIMSMNNVAITQAHAINVIGTALLPELIELSGQSIKKFGEYLRDGQRCLSAASGCGPFVLACQAACVAVYGVLLAHLSIKVIYPLIQIWQDLNIPVTDFVFKPLDLLTGKSTSLPDDTTALGHISDYEKMGQALIAMNKHVAENSNGFAKETVTAVSDRNGLSPLADTVFLFAAYKQTDPFGLPVETVEFGGEGSGSDGNTLAKGIGREICKTGYLGTAFIDPTGQLISLDFNFQEHGYDWYKGPYVYGRDSVSEAIKKPREAFKGFPHGGPEPKVRFDKAVDPMYATACSLRQFVKFPTIFGGGFIPYRVASDPGPRSALNYGKRDSRDQWSIFGFSKFKRKDATVMGRWFVNDPNAQYASAQAEVYNGVWYDLYTQDWHAKLVSTHMLDSKNDGSDFNSGALQNHSSDGVLQEKLIAAVEEFDKDLHQTLKNSQAALKDVNAH